ncbi:hypothetical protein BGZ76_004415 [Entomortierella beljakovae]|nr:hypothetical protein BGZ76_004415 [Entomortierella beljakovae]
MSYDPVKSPDNRNNSSQGNRSSFDDLDAPGSPYLDLLNQSFSTTNDLSLPDLVIASPTPSNLSIPYEQQASKNKSRIMDALLKRGSKDTLRTDRSFQSAAPSPALSKAQPSLNHDASVGGSTSSVSSISQSTQPKSILKQSKFYNNTPSTSTKPPATQQIQYQQQQQQQQQYNMPVAIPPQFNNTPNDFNNNNYNNYGRPNSEIQDNYTNQRLGSGFPIAGLVPPASPMANSFNGSSSGGGNSPSSIQRFSKNNSSLGDFDYNMTQSNLTLDGLEHRWHAYQSKMKRRYAEVPFYRRWTKSKWMLLLSSILLLGYSVAIVVIMVGYLTQRLEHSPVIMEFHYKIIYVGLFAGIGGILSALVGLYGTIRENRIWLSIYTTILWPVFALFVAAGYIAFKRSHNHLRSHLRDEWIHYTREQRLLVQRNLKCCGLQTPSWYAEYDLRCFPMTVLPGCQHKYTIFEGDFLETVWTVSFSILPVQLFVMVAALLCSNHVDGMFRSARPGLKSFKEEKNE